MTKRPWSLTLFSILMLAIAVSVPVQAGLLQDFDELGHYLSMLNWIMIGLCLGTAWTAFSAQKSFRWVMPVTIAVVFINNWWVGTVNFDFSMAETSLASLGFLGVHVLLLERNALQVLKNPDLKWWRRSPRRQLQVPVVLFPLEGRRVMRTLSHDLSATGMFVQGLHEDEFGRLALGDRFQIHLNLDRRGEIICNGEIVRKSGANGSYPEGLGIRFKDLGSAERRALAQFQN